MKNIELSKKSIVAIAVALILVVFGVFSCSSGNDDESETRSQSSILVPSTTRAIENLTDKSTTTNPNTTLPKYQKFPFSEAVKKALYALPTTGEAVQGNPGAYVSPRYEAILGGDTSSGIPISELDNPDHSDLDPGVFNVARSSAIEITEAQITGVGAEKYPVYFGPGNEPGNCRSFKLKHAGATSLPIPNDNRWIIAPVLWKATCGDGSTYTVEQQTAVYFTLSNGVLTPRPYSEVPGA